MSRRFKLFLTFAVIVVLGYGASRLLSSSYSVPSEFQNARMQGALIAQNIVDLSNQSSRDLEEVNALDENGKFDDAFARTNELVERSVEIRNQAVALADEVGKMTKALSGIQSFDARQAALESIASRLALINRLIKYSNYLSQLLDALRSRFSGAVATSSQVAALVNQINIEVRAINTFNGQAGQAMDRFDKIIRQ